MLNEKAIKQAIEQNDPTGNPINAIPELIQLGVRKYDYNIAKGRYCYYDDQSSLNIKTKHTPKSVSELGETLKIKQAVLKYQNNEISFEEFCSLAGEAGVAHWTCDLTTKETTYFDQNEFILLIVSESDN
jgi:uncharacterized protein YbcV (DUF1398 family)